MNYWPGCRSAYRDNEETPKLDVVLNPRTNSLNLKSASLRNTPHHQRAKRSYLVFGLFKKNPLEKWQKEQESLINEAFQAQRNGNIRLYSTLTAQAEELREKIEAAKSAEDR